MQYRGRDGGTDCFLRIKEQETCRNLCEHDYDDDDDEVQYSQLRLPPVFVLFCTIPWQIKYCSCHPVPSAHSPNIFDPQFHTGTPVTIPPIMDRPPPTAQPIFPPPNQPFATILLDNITQLHSPRCSYVNAVMVLWAFWTPRKGGGRKKALVTSGKCAVCMLNCLMWPCFVFPL